MSPYFLRPLTMASASSEIIRTASCYKSLQFATGPASGLHTVVKQSRSFILEHEVIEFNVEYGLAQISGIFVILLHLVVK